MEGREKKTKGLQRAERHQKQIKNDHEVKKSCHLPEKSFRRINAIKWLGDQVFVVVKSILNIKFRYQDFRSLISRTAGWNMVSRAKRKRMGIDDPQAKR